MKLWDHYLAVRRKRFEFCLLLYLKCLPHCLSGFFLGGGCDVGVGVQSEACGEMTEHTADRLDVHSVLEGDGCKGMAEVVESNLRYASSCQHSL